jgi:hypothetical protein
VTKHEELMELFKKDHMILVHNGHSEWPFHTDFEDDLEIWKAPFWWAIGKGLSLEDARAFARDASIVVIFGEEE